MDQFVRTYRQQLLAAAFVVLGVMLCGYALLYSHYSAMIEHVRRAQAELDKETRALAKAVDQQQARSAQESTITSLPDFLSHINKIARDSRVIVRELTPDPRHHLTFNLNIHADYYTFLTFAANLESHNVRIRDIQVRPFNFISTPPVHQITFALTPRNNAEPLLDERMVALRAAVAQRDLRNPFQRPPTCGAQKNEIDLTWIHHLTGIGTDPQGKVATIDRLDYRVGDLLTATDQLGPMTVTQIADRLVRLQRDTERGLQEIVLTFRDAPPPVPLARPGAVQSRR